MTNIFNTLLKAKSEIQIAHILQKDKKYSTHMILGDLYSELDEKVDDIMEKYLGLGHSLTGIKYEVGEIEDVLSYIQKLYKDIESAKGNFTESIFVADLEDIQSTLAGVLYKLQFVK